ncbi:MAG TPA: helix-turn-helix domain-containing protein [Microlunatus sp.]
MREDGTLTCPGDREGTVQEQGTAPLRDRRVRQILDRVGDKWSLLVIGLLGEGDRRFNEIRRRVDGISQRMLSVTLRGLERDGLVARTVYPTVPPKVEYSLTVMGRTLLSTVCELVEWADQYAGDVDTARTRYDRAKTADSAAQDVGSPASLET